METDLHCLLKCSFKSTNINDFTYASYFLCALLPPGVFFFYSPFFLICKIKSNANYRNLRICTVNPNSFIFINLFYFFYAPGICTISRNFIFLVLLFSFSQSCQGKTIDFGLQDLSEALILFIFNFINIFGVKNFYNGIGFFFGTRNTLGGNVPQT